MNLLDLAPPHSVEAEQGVIGGLMLDNSAWDLVADMLSAEDFFRRETNRIVSVIDLPMPVGTVTVLELLNRIVELERMLPSSKVVPLGKGGKISDLALSSMGIDL